jgi:hypothetical protein
VQASRTSCEEFAILVRLAHSLHREYRPDLYQNPRGQMPLGKISLFGGDADSPVCREAPTGTNHPATALASLARLIAPEAVRPDISVRHPSYFIQPPHRRGGKAT